MSANPMDMAHVERFIAAQSSAAAAQAAQVGLRLKYLQLRDSGSTLPSLLNRRTDVVCAR